MIYFLRRANGDIKIGITSGILDGRKAQLERRYGSLDILGIVDGGRNEEAILHARFYRIRKDGEWFTATDELLEFIQQDTHAQVKRELSPIHLPALPMPDKSRSRKMINRLQELMIVAGVTIDDVAIGTGVSHNTLSRWYKNYVDRFETVVMDKLIDYFKCNVSDLLAIVPD